MLEGKTDRRFLAAHRQIGYPRRSGRTLWTLVRTCLIRDPC
jgi:hypothetical protein